MKKLFAMILALAMLLTCSFSLAEENNGLMAGGWMLTKDGVIDENAQAAFDKAIGDIGTVTALRLLGTQVVAGINYSFLTFNDYGENSYYAILTVYADLEGDAVVTDEVDITLGARGAEEMDDTQNPVMNYIGEYADKTSERAMLSIQCVAGDKGLLTLHWANSASDGVEWVFTCDFDPEKGLFTYTEGVRKEYTADEDGNISYGDIKQDLKGTFTIHADDTITWEPEGEDADNGCVFEFMYME